MSTWLDTRPADQVVAAMDAMRTQPQGRPFMEYANGDAGFAVWLWNVNRRILRRYGIGLFDLSDWCARDAFDAGMSPAEAAAEALANDDTFSMLAEALS